MAADPSEAISSRSMIGETRGKRTLEDDHIGQRDEAERSVLRAEEHVPVFPGDLHGADHPAVALADEAAHAALR
jgi:hypothetical protein